MCINFDEVIDKFSSAKARQIHLEDETIKLNNVFRILHTCVLND